MGKAEEITILPPWSCIVKGWDILENRALKSEGLSHVVFVRKALKFSSKKEALLEWWLEFHQAAAAAVRKLSSSIKDSVKHPLLLLRIKIWSFGWGFWMPKLPLKVNKSNLRLESSNFESAFSMEVAQVWLRKVGRRWHLLFPVWTFFAKTWTTVCIFEDDGRREGLVRACAAVICSSLQNYKPEKASPFGKA